MIALFHTAWPQCRPSAGNSAPPPPSGPTASTTTSPAGLPRTTERQTERRRMVDQQMAARDIRDARVLAAMRNVPRHWFVPEDSARSAYDDRPLPIGWDQTISQPYIVALMTQLLAIKPGEKVLEIGTGSGYQAAVLAELTEKVYTIEIVEPLAKRTIDILRERGYKNIHVRIGDGYLGWPEEAPFDAIIVTCAPEDPPPALIKQLAAGGRMCIPVGSLWTGQELILLRKEKDGTLKKESVAPVQFVPMTGKAQDKRP
ncbi:MAG TPA: protein-L-isoaspartate(D-aspartate) O-methyltransferase [Phycisphaerae bacterium]|nr:protein-L-isoaspartate(D-aspartate) O-methyltransferase [Phycisphaerae bacterium]